MIDSCSPLSVHEANASAGTESIEMTIPARTIQIDDRGEQNLPPLSRSAVATVRRFNVGFEHLFFDDARMHDFVEQHFPQYRRTFHAFTFPIQRFDFFRYLAIYKFGGFYFDTDVFLGRDLSPLLEMECVFPFEALTTNDFLRRVCGMDWEVGNYAFGAAPGHPFIGELIRNCVRSTEDPDWAMPMMQSIPRLFRDEFTVLFTTGPGMVTRTLAESRNISRRVSVLFPDDVCDQKNWNLFGDYGVHVMQGRWRGSKHLVRRRLLRMWQSRRLHRLVEESKTLGKQRSFNHCGVQELSPSVKSW
jgi:hypothetical protein